MLNWVQVRALAGPFKNCHGVVVKPLLRYFSCVLRVIVLLEGKPSAQSEVLSTLEKVFVQDIPVLGRIHLSLDCNQSSCPCSWKTPPQHDAATTMLHCWDCVGQVMSSAWFSTHIPLRIKGKRHRFSIFQYNLDELICTSPVSVRALNRSSARHHYASV